jgi:hypothetical protein
MFENVHAQWKLASFEPTEQDHENYHSLLKDGGFSHNPFSNKSPDSGFMVGVHHSHGGVERKIPLSEFRPEHLAEHRQAASEALKDSHTYQGGWVQDGHVHLDISRNHQDRDHAIEEGKRHDQIAIYDIKNNSDIATGGKGTS